MSISDEAFAEAKRAYRETLTSLRLAEGDGFKVASQVDRSIRAALEATAPYLMAGAWDEAANTLYMGNAINQEHLKAMWAQNPYRSSGAVESRLRSRHEL